MEIKIATESEKQLVFALRTEVFVKEQKVPVELEIDAEDNHATHIIATENNITVGCARVLFEGDAAHIGRLAVKKEFRGQGLGLKICEFIIDYCKNKGYTKVWLNSQTHAMGFYEKLGFNPVGEYFFEAGIEHIKMEI